MLEKQDVEKLVSYIEGKGKREDFEQFLKLKYGLENSYYEWKWKLVLGKPLQLPDEETEYTIVAEYLKFHNLKLSGMMTEQQSLFVEVSIEHWNMVLSYAGLMSGFMFLGISLNGAGLQSMYILKASSTLMTIGFLLALLSTVLCLTMIGLFRHSKVREHITFEDLQKYEVLRDVPMTMAVIATLAFLGGINIIIWDYLGFNLSLSVNIICGAFTLIGLSTETVLNISKRKLRPDSHKVSAFNDNE